MPATPESTAKLFKGSSQRAELPSSFSFTVHGEPTSGSNLRFNRSTGRAYRPGQHQQYVLRVRESASNALGELSECLYPREVKLALSAVLCFAWRKQDYGTGRNAGKLKPSAPKFCVGNKDIDNLLKPLKDGMKGVVYEDDKQIVMYENIVKCYTRVSRTIVTVSIVDEDEWIYEEGLWTQTQESY